MQCIYQLMIIINKSVCRILLLLLLLLLLLTDICLRKLMYITNAHAVNSHEKILLSPEKKRFKEFFE